jgi:hypothetical protein
MKERFMTTQVVDWAADFLATEDDFLIPIKKLWLMAQGNRLATDLSLDAFHCLLEEDGRFEFDEGIDFGEDFDDPEVEREIMESHGYFSGRRVRLAAREITFEMIATAITRSTDRMMTALEGAWQVRDLGDQEEETRLLDLLAHGQRLQEGMDEIFGGLAGQGDEEEAENP